MKFKKYKIFLTVVLLAVIIISLFFMVESPEKPIEKAHGYLSEVPVSEIEAKGKITGEEAEKLCAEVMGDKAIENGFPISYRCIGGAFSEDKYYYVMHISWLVNNSHWSYIGNAFVSSDGREIYDGIATGETYEITNLRWEK